MIVVSVWAFDWQSHKQKTVTKREPWLNTKNNISAKSFQNWLTGFTEHYGTIGCIICGVFNAMNDHTVHHLKGQMFPKLIKGSQAKDDYKIDNTGLFFNLLPWPMAKRHAE